VADWEEGMSVGVEFLDVHHRQMWRRIRHLANAVSDGRADEVRAALRFLQSYLSEHDAEEERWMEEAGYPGAREHVRAHAAVLDRIRAAREDESAGSDRRLFEAADWVARALEAHMRSDDLKLGRFWTARENLRRLAEAGPGLGAALTPIPGMLATVPPRARGDEGEPAPAPPPADPAER
jgi:hemerythrin